MKEDREVTFPRETRTAMEDAKYPQSSKLAYFKPEYLIFP